MQTVCAYCGVGCKFEIQNGHLQGLKSYPINKGMSCAKGVSQIESMDKNRLTQVQVRESINDEFEPSNYKDAISKIVQSIKKSDPSRIGFYLSGQMLNEDYYVANKLAKGFVGTPHCDTNSRTCMSSAVVGYKKAYGVDYVPVRIEDIYHAKLLILIGSNAAESHVVLFNHIKKAQKNGLKVVVIDPRFTPTAKIADLYLPIAPNGDIDLLNLLAKRLIESDAVDQEFIQNHTNGYDDLKKALASMDSELLLSRSGLDANQIDELVQLWQESDRVITAWTMGVNQSSQGVDKNLAIHNLHLITAQINKKGAGPFSLTGQPNAMGGREVGGLSTMLAVHLDYTPENINKVSKFWDAPKLPNANGLSAFEMLEAAYEGELDILIICHTDPVYHLPNRHFVEEAIKKCKLVVEINAYEGSETSSYAHIRLPALPFGYKEGTQVNMDRTLTRVESFVSDSEILQDWQIFAMIGKALGYQEAFDYSDTKEVFEEYQQMCRLSQDAHLDIYKADYERLKSEPFEWGAGLFEDDRFMTPDKKARLHIVQNLEQSEQRDESHPFILLTGRTRDQWHSGSKTAKIDKLLKYKPLHFVEINPDDADNLGIIDGDKVEIISKRGKLVSVAKITTIKKGAIFLPLSHREINYLTNDILDPQSKEPDYNHSAVAIRKI